MCPPGRHPDKRPAPAAGWIGAPAGEFTYFGANGGNFFLYYFYMTYGARTESGNLPTGTAHYFGRMEAQAYEKDHPLHDQRVCMSGRIVLTADLDESTLYFPPTDATLPRRRLTWRKHDN